MLTDTGLAISTAHSRAETSHCDISKLKVMMTEQRDGSDGRWAVLNDWDHALWTDASPTDRVVSIFGHTRLSLSTLSLAGYLAVHFD